MFVPGQQYPGKLQIGNRGVAALEFAVVTPVLLLMILGMMCFGLYFMYIHTIDELTSSAARASVGGLSQAERNQLAQQFVSNFVAGSNFINISDLTVTTATSGSPATQYQVTLTYTLKDTPIPMLASLASVKANTISYTSTVVFGGY